MMKCGNKSKAWLGLANSRVPLFTCLVLFLLILVVFIPHNGERHTMSSEISILKWNTFESMQFDPHVEFRNGTDVIWQIPDSPKAVLFIAHGCNGKAFNFWDKCPNCPNCIGLPEERLLVIHALAHKFAVLTISSAGRCWTFGDEIIIVEDIIRWWLQRERLVKFPLVALGASSGGYFVSVLATSVKFSSITLMIAAGMFDQMDITEHYPPTLFVHMPKDAFRQQRISEFMAILKNKGIDVAEVQCMEFPLSPSFLANRIPRINQGVSSMLFELLRDKGFVDENGYMKKDGRATHWKEALHTAKDIQLDKDLMQHVQEELNLAFAYHEMTSLQSQKIFGWFESHME